MKTRVKKPASELSSLLRIELVHARAAEEKAAGIIRRYEMLLVMLECRLEQQLDLEAYAPKSQLRPLLGKIKKALDRNEVPR